MNGKAGTGKITIAFSFYEKAYWGKTSSSALALAECSDIRYIIPTTSRRPARYCPQIASALEVLC